MRRFGLFFYRAGMSISPAGSRQVEAFIRRMEAKATQSTDQIAARVAAEKDVLDQQQLAGMHSLLVAPDREPWKAPFLPKPSCDPSTALDDAAKAMATLPLPTNPRLVFLALARAQARGLLPSVATSPSTSSSTSITPTPTSSTTSTNKPSVSGSGQGAYALLAAEINAEMEKLGAQYGEQNVKQEQNALQQIEAIYSLSQELTDLSADIANDKLTVSQKEAAIANLQKDPAVVAAIKALFADGDVHLIYSIGYGPNNNSVINMSQFFQWLGQTHGTLNGSEVDSARISVNWAGIANLPPSIQASVKHWIGTVWGLFNGPGKGNSIAQDSAAWHELTGAAKKAAASISADRNDIKNLQGYTNYKYMLDILPGDQAAVEAAFAAAGIALPPHTTNAAGGWDFYFSSAGQRNAAESACNNAGAYVNNVSTRKTNVPGLIATTTSDFLQQGAALAKLLGLPDTLKIDINTVDEIIAILQKAKKFVAMALEGLNGQGNALAVFTAFKNAIEKQQQHNIELIGANQDKVTNYTLDILNQQQEILKLINTITLQLASENATLQADQTKLNQDQQTSIGGTIAAGIGALIGLIPGCEFFGAAIAAAGIGASIGTNIAIGILEHQMGKLMATMAGQQTTLATDQGIYGRDQAAASFLSTLASNTSATLTTLIQTEIKNAQLEMAAFNAATQAVASAASI